MKCGKMIIKESNIQLKTMNDDMGGPDEFSLEP
jgi:hypothetical protein